MTDIEAAEKTLASLNDKRDRATARVDAIADERKQISFAVHADNDKAARKRLDALNADSATIASELASIDAALVEATARLEAARHAEATKADRAAAKELRQQFDHFVALAEQMDAALAAVVSTSNEMQVAVNKIHACGSASPTGQQLLALGSLSLNTALMQTIWRREFQHLPPHQRRTFTQLVTGWRDAAESNNIKPRLSEQRETADAA